LFGTGDIDGMSRGFARQFKIGRVKAHEGLAFSHMPALIHQLFDNFPRHSEAKVTFCTGMHGAGVAWGACIRATNREATHNAGGILRDGRLAVPALSSGSVPTNAAFEANATCPNGNWTKETLVSSITLSSFTYTLTFAGFNSPYITITGP